jgi:hypothetical protein
MQWAISILLGLGLAASCGFRVFVPLLVTNVASMLGYVKLAGGFEWMGTWIAFAVFATATLAEIAAYYIPWLDNALDAISTPLAIIAGSVLTSSFITDMDPMLRWVLAIIVGGGSAGVIKASAVVIRLGSSTLTGGLGNSLLATIENFVSILFSIVSIVVPVIAGISAIIVTAFSLNKLVKGRNLLRVRKTRQLNKEVK